MFMPVVTFLLHCFGDMHSQSQIQMVDDSEAVAKLNLSGKKHTRRCTPGKQHDIPSTS
jgi:hypothetical protein